MEVNDNFMFLPLYPGKSPGTYWIGGQWTVWMLWTFPSCREYNPGIQPVTSHYVRLMMKYKLKYSFEISQLGKRFGAENRLSKLGYQWLCSVTPSTQIL
jgi:hypothetical protein